MKKRLIAAVLCLALLLALSWGRPVQEEGENYDLYFRVADLAEAPGGDALGVESIFIPAEEASDPAALAEYLMQALLAGPEDSALMEVTPSETELLSLELDGSRAIVDLSGRYRLLSGVALALADYAITLTLTQLPEIASVNITVRGQQLAYRDRQTFTARDVLFSSNEDVIGTVPATLYLLDGESALTPRTVSLDLYEGDTQVGAVVKALLSESEDTEYSSPLPEGFRVTSVRLDGEVCYVDLPSAALTEMEQGTDMRQALRALADSLLSLQVVTEVRYLVDGEYAVGYGTASVVVPYTA